MSNEQGVRARIESRERRGVLGAWALTLVWNAAASYAFVVVPAMVGLRLSPTLLPTRFTLAP